MLNKSTKSEKRTKYLEMIMSELKHDHVYKVLDYKNTDEAKIKTFIYPRLLNRLTKVIMEEGKNEDKALSIAEKQLLWEGNTNTTVNNSVVFGTQHRPDMVIKTKDLSIAIELKRGESGQMVREGIGQSVVYSSAYDFVVTLLIDTSKDGKVKNGFTGDIEQAYVKSLWDNYNIMLSVV